MSEQKLDADAHINKKRKPASMLKVGILFGVLAGITIFITGRQVFDSNFPMEYMAIIFGAIAQFYIAAFGSRKHHLVKIWAVGGMVPIVGIAVDIITRAIIGAYNYSHQLSLLLLVYFGLASLVFFVLSFLFWFFLGQSSYFRNLIAE
ncbi:hypothetical protein BH09BAC1_BH09BAC1_12760 [soil metagenome]